MDFHYGLVPLESFKLSCMTLEVRTRRLLVLLAALMAGMIFPARNAFAQG